MNIIKELYNKIVSLNLEYDNILELDKLYMNIFLQENQNIINTDINIDNNSNIDNDINFMNNEINEINEKKNVYKDRKCIKLYRNLAKLMHPDKNKKHKDNFIKLNKAYNNNDYITLFMYGYEFDIINKLCDDEIIIIENEIKQKEKKIENIINKIHWQWVKCNNNIEKELIKTHIINNLND